jgi:hypothetical protein
MKRIFILLVLASFTISGFSQTKSKSAGISASKTQNNKTSTVFVQLVGDESINTLQVKFKLFVGVDNKFYIQDKNDIELYDMVASDIVSFQNFPDALNYLSDKGFVIENFSSVMFHDNIRHTLILSRTTYNQ